MRSNKERNEGGRPKREGGKEEGESRKLKGKKRLEGMRVERKESDIEKWREKESNM